jgi:tetratricopeptide (TPR) repeat protein
LELILDEFPDDIGAMNDLGYLWADRNKNLELALDMVQKAVASDPDNRAYRDSLGWVYYRLGRFAEAVVELEKACEPEKTDSGEADEPDGVILDHLGDAYAAAGRTDDARKVWHRAEKSFDKQGDKAKLEAVRKKLAK